MTSEPRRCRIDQKRVGQKHAAGPGPPPRRRLKAKLLAEDAPPEKAQRSEHRYRGECIRERIDAGEEQQMIDQAEPGPEQRKDRCDEAPGICAGRTTSTTATRPSASSTTCAGHTATLYCAKTGKNWSTVNGSRMRSGDAPSPAARQIGLVVGIRCRLAGYARETPQGSLRGADDPNRLAGRASDFAHLSRHLRPR